MLKKLKTKKKQHAHNSNGSEGLRRALLCVTTATGLDKWCSEVVQLFCLYSRCRPPNYGLVCNTLQCRWLMWELQETLVTLLFRCLTCEMQTNQKVPNLVQANIDDKTSS